MLFRLAYFETRRLTTIFYSSVGGATVTTPAGGYGNQDLSVYFEQKARVASRSPTRAIPTPTNTNTPIPTNASSHPRKSLSTGAIIGVSIVGSVIIIVLLMGGCFAVQRHRRMNKEKELPQSPATQNGTPDYSQIIPQSPRTQRSQGTEPHQLQGDCIPAELAGSTDSYHLNGWVHKQAMMEQIEVQDQPAYNNARWIEVDPPSPSPIASSLHSHGYSPVMDTNTMSAPPTYLSGGRSPRRPPLQNETYYQA
jgi:hypothetical protein